MTASPVQRVPALTVLDVREELSQLDSLLIAAAVSYASASAAGREDAAAAALAEYVDFSARFQAFFGSLSPAMRLAVL